MARILISSLHQPTLDNQRGRLDQSRVRYFLKHPDEIRNVLVYENPTDGERILVNGFHRVEAARILGRTMVAADLRPGTRSEAVLYLDAQERQPWSEIEAGTRSAPLCFWRERAPEPGSDGTGGGR